MAERTCSFDGCSNRHDSHGLCGSHRMQRGRGGPLRPLRVVLRGQTPAARFWAKVDKHGPPPTHLPELGPCWLWTARLNHKRFGYGMFQYGSSRETSYVGPAHIWSWQAENGPVPDRLCVLHRCDVPACVRPDHLFLGTRADNLRDMCEKGRHGWSSRTACPKCGGELVEIPWRPPARRCEPCTRIAKRADYLQRKARNDGNKHPVDGAPTAAA